MCLKALAEYSSVCLRQDGGQATVDNISPKIFKKCRLLRQMVSYMRKEKDMRKDKASAKYHQVQTGRTIGML